MEKTVEISESIGNTRIIFKRIMAYIIDIFIVSILVTLISQIKIINPNYNKQVDAYNELVEYYEQHVSNQSNVSTEDLLTPEYKELTYKVSYYGLSNLIVSFSVAILYFVLFPMFNRSQTIGKRLLKIKYINEDGSKVKWYTYLLRALILPIRSSFLLVTPLTYLFNAIALLFNPNIYSYINTSLILVFCIYGYVDVIMLVSSKKGRSLHDIISKTKVIDYK